MKSDAEICEILNAYDLDGGRRRARRLTALCAAAAAVAAGVVFALPAVAQARDDQQTAAVAIGDSYISGEGGRWQGNAAPWTSGGDWWGTDRAAYACSYLSDLESAERRCLRDPRRVYGDSYSNGCDRSDIAEISSAKLPMQHAINLACSGAETNNVIAGDQPFKGEPPQADQLASLAGKYDIKLIVVSIGGNDLGFSKIMEACGEAFVLGKTPCSVEGGATRDHFDGALTALRENVQAALTSIVNTMEAAHHPRSSYRLVLQSYPEPVPVSTQYRYWQTERRYTTGGCPLYNVDNDWAYNTILPDVRVRQRQAAQAVGADFLDLTNAFAGHELCSKQDRQALSVEDLDHPIPASSAEWIRFVTKWTQGIKQESIHPNAYGQQALGDCLHKLQAAGAGSFSCTGAAGKSPQDMVLDPLRKN